MDMVKAAYRGQEYDMHFPGAEEEVRATKTILCNGKRLGVTANLYEALLSLRETRPGNGEYWIDAVCMNQRYPASSPRVSKNRRKTNIAEWLTISTAI